MFSSSLLTMLRMRRIYSVPSGRSTRTVQVGLIGFRSRSYFAHNEGGLSKEEFVVVAREILPKVHVTGLACNFTFDL